MEIHQLGIPCTVFEQDASLEQRRRDWDFGIYWAQTPLDECLPQDVRDQILTALVDRLPPHPDAFMPGFNAATGDEIHRIPTPHYLRMRRRELSRVLGKELDIRVRLYTFFIFFFCVFFSPAGGGGLPFSKDPDKNISMTGASSIWEPKWTDKRHCSTANVW